MRILGIILALLVIAPLPGRAEPPNVVADIAPVHALVAMVMGPVGTPELLLSADASPHAANLRPSDARRLSAADVVIQVGHDLTPWLGKSLDALASEALVLSLLDAPGTMILETREGPLFEVGDAAHDDHDHGAVDPHAWLLPRNAMAWLDAIATALGQVDPENADAYGQNAAAAGERLGQLEAALAAQLAPLADVAFLTQHDGTQYFEAAFGLASRGAISSTDGVAPGAARIGRLRNAIEADDIACLLAEPLEGRRSIDAVAGAGTLRVAEIDLISMGAAPGADLYAQLLVAIADAVAACLGGGDGS